MIRAILVDDEKPALEKMKRLLGRQSGLTVTGAFTSAARAMEHVRLQGAEVVFLDIEMPGLNGMEAAEKIIDLDGNIDVVFVTAFDYYAVEAFEINALDYLLKPISAERLAKTLSRIAAKRGSRTETRAGLHFDAILCFQRFELLNRKTGPVRVNWRTAKTRELFALLVHNRNTQVSKEKLVEILWPNTDKERSSHLLHTTAYYLRKLLHVLGHDNLLQYSNNHYFLDLRGVYCDIDEFRRIVGAKGIAENSADDLSKAVELYRGDYFEEEDFLWSAPERSRLRHILLDLLKKVSRSYLDQHRYAEAEKLLRLWLEKEPLSEEANRLMMEAYAGQGKRQRLIRHFEEYKKTLLEEIGTVPDKSTKLIFYKLLNESIS